MEDAIAAAEATLEALVKAAEDFAVPLIAEQRAVLAAADAKAGDAPPDSEYGKARAEFEKKIDELDGALTSAVEKERAEIGVVAKAARSDPSAGDEGADAATVVASVFDPAREHLGERLRGSRSAAEKMLQWLEGRASDLDRAAADAAAKPPDAPEPTPTPTPTPTTPRTRKTGPPTTNPTSRICPRWAETGRRTTRTTSRRSKASGKRTPRPARTLTRRPRRRKPRRSSHATRHHLGATRGGTRASATRL